MKRKIWIISVTFVVTLTMFTISCKKDEPTITPTPTTTRVESREKFLGNYSVIDTIFTPDAGAGSYFYSNYIMTISKSQNDTSRISILNINNSGDTIYAIVSGSIFSVPNQNYSGWGISGNGNINNNKLRFDLIIPLPLGNRKLYGVGTKL